MAKTFLFISRKLVKITCIILLIPVLYNCEKENIFELQIPAELIRFTSGKEQLTHADSVVISRLPAYYNFLNTLKQEGYTFIDFRTFLKTDTSLLPEKLIVIRHDVHKRDIQWAYTAFRIEQIVIGAGRSTFYIMLNDPCELEQSGSNVQNSYRELIHFLDSNGADIQPHVSPVDLYIEHVHPEWENYPLDTLHKMFHHNYFFGKYKDGKRINVRGEDVFDINSMNRDIKTLLSAYNQEWTEHTGLKVQGYAAHGSATPMNRVINNADLLDQVVLRKAGIFEYDAYNSKIFEVLTYLSDNSLPQWMKDPGSITPDRYQFLMHPYQWTVIRN